MTKVRDFTRELLRLADLDDEIFCTLIIEKDGGEERYTTSRINILPTGPGNIEIMIEVEAGPMAEGSVA